MDRQRYIIVVLHASESLEKSVEIHLFNSKFAMGTDEFNDEVEEKFKIGSYDDWRSYLITSARRLKLFSDYLNASARRIDVTATLLNEREQNKNQIALPIEEE
jgi:hypothetical protein